LRRGEILAFALPLAIYLASSYHDVMYWDAGEMDTVPYILGIAHPPGYPLYTLLGWVFTHLVPAGSVAFRMSALSAIAMACACWCIARAGGTAAALLFAFGGVVWAHATRAEPHAFVALACVAVLLFLLRWLQGGSARDLYAVAAALGLGVAVHPLVASTLPGILAAIVARADETAPRVLRRAALIACACAAVWFLYLPLRSAYVNAQHLDPAAALGISGGAFWNYGDPALFANWAALVTGRDVGVEGVPYGFTAHAYVLGVVHFVQVMLSEFTPAGSLLGLAGLVAMFRRDLTRALVAVLTMFPSALFAFGFGAESDVDRYFLPAFALVAIAAGTFARELRPRMKVTVTAAMAILTLYLLLSQPHFFDQPHDRRAAGEAAEVVAATPSDAIVIATWVIAPPLAYDAYVLHRTGDRTILASWYGDQIDRIPQWSASRPVFVAGTPEGSVPGYHLERMPTHTELYRVEKNGSQ